jgi:glycerol kinase
MINSTEEIETCIKSVPDNGVFCTCTDRFRGTTLGSIRTSAIVGITRGTTNAHIALPLEGIAYQVYDLVKLWKLILAKKEQNYG